MKSLLKVLRSTRVHSRCKTKSFFQLLYDRGPTTVPDPSVPRWKRRSWRENFTSLGFRGPVGRKIVEQRNLLVISQHAMATTRWRREGSDDDCIQFGVRRSGWGSNGSIGGRLVGGARTGATQDMGPFNSKAIKVPHCTLPERHRSRAAVSSPLKVKWYICKNLEKLQLWAL